MTTQRTSVAANPRIPAPKNEPAREFRPGSPEAESVLREIDRLNNEVREITHVIGGERIGGDDTKNIVAPHDHQHVYATIPNVTDEIIDKAIQAALDAQYDWSRTPWWERAAIFQRVGELAAGKYRDELVATTMIGQSKTFHQAEIDAACEVTDFMRYNTYLASQIYADQPPSLTGDINTIDQRPLEGFVLALTPFNFTAITANLPSTPALMGNTVVWKTSEKAALASEVLYRLFEEAGVPPGVINLVHGSGRHISERALAHPDFAGFTFTGSTEVFRGLWKQAAQNIDAYKSFPRIVGETGGKNAVVAHPTADPDAVRVALIRAGFEYQGQKCSAASRAYIARSVWDAIKDELVETVRGLPVGDPTKHETYVSAVIDEASLRKLENAFERAAELDSHTLLAGGKVHDETGWFVEPTIYESTDPTAFTFKEEFFGPLLAVYVYEDDEFEDVLPLVDSTSEYALTLSIFGSDRAAISHALDVLRNTAGMTYINDKPSGALMGQVSFGGGRASGTNDKTGSRLALQRWVNGRFIKESLDPATDWTYPYLNLDA
ncbi:L-glutamate gamma-semialdehyde dehydrogenase [Gulosibacter sp. 10]|uniref:L-glutamate gamma-semialdehyde dehydrogenase n=1 Tax=Gulosibacter sp. 10 TaxID=1255570 RepID=UPI001C3DE5E7|nr:L-glutamate gamma-semialdehyde dehydrogenase [Gulosibacter sp. 10]